MLAESALARAMATSSSGMYLAALALALGANEFEYGKLAGAVFVGGSLQLLVVPLLTWIGSRRRFCLVGLGATRFFRVCLAAAPLLVLWNVTPGGVMWVMFFALVLSAITGTASETARQSWMSDLIPKARLGRFIGWRSAVMQCAGIVTMLAYAAYLEFWRYTGHDPIPGFQYLILFGTGLGVIGLFLIAKAPEPPMSERLSPRLQWVAVTLPLRDARFRRFIVFFCLWTLAMPMAGMFFHLYMLDYLGLRHRPMGYVLVAATDIISMLVGMASAPLWGRLADRWGTKRVLLRAGFVMALFPLLWIPITPGLWWLIFVVILVRVFGSACDIGPMTMAMQMAPRRRRSIYISVYRSLGCVTQAVAPMVGGAIAHKAGPSFWTLGAFTFTGLHLLFVISTFGRLLSLWWLRRVN
ncbi:MAG: MFS transporter [Phycisphaerae bacterium]|nr:MFS transporter [Phycisphaerae bacterium]